MLRIHFTNEDLVRTRVAPSADPFWEMRLSLHSLQRSSGRQRLLDEKRVELASLLEALLPVAPATGYNPDFLTPLQGLLGLEEGLAAILATPEHRLHHELGLLAEAGQPAPRADVTRRGATGYLAGLVDALRRYHRFVLEPFWPRVQTVVRADRAIRERALLEGGVEQLLARLGPRVRWTSPVLRVAHPADRDLHLGGRGLVLIPSSFCQGPPLALADPELPPVLVYPADRGGTRPATPGARRHLESLLGTTRAAILLAATTTRSTTALARLLGVSVATASYHLSVLRDVGLVLSHRQANVVNHTVSPLGISLLNGAAATSADQNA